MVILKDIDESNWRTPLEVAPEQRSYVSDRASLLARAYAYRNARSRAFLVCQGEEAVGMGLYYDCEELGCYDISQLFIDARWQGRGLGREAVGRILEELRADGRYEKVALCYIDGNQAARRLYESFGFRETGREGNEIVMELALREGLVKGEAL